ncbi:MAG: hypothetical protein IKB86_04375 [Clostridia bacterium]|nr:hypothetical protein [Clostridia bacterium]
MPLGLVILSMLIFLILIKKGERICACLSAKPLSAVILLTALVLSYIIPPLFLQNVYVYYAPFIICIIYLGILLFRLSHPAKSAFTAFLSACILLGVSIIVSPEPKGLMLEPFAIYTLVITLCSVLFSYSESSVVFNNLCAFLFFNLALLFFESYFSFFDGKIFSSVCASTFLSFIPLFFLESKGLLSKNKLLLSFEASESQLITKSRKRKNNSL